jgi:hypothetical protein
LVWAWLFASRRSIGGGEQFDDQAAAIAVARGLLLQRMIMRRHLLRDHIVEVSLRTKGRLLERRSDCRGISWNFRAKLK